MSSITLRESACARLCLLTYAAWTPQLPPPMSRNAARRLIEAGAIEGLVLRQVPGIDEALMEQACALLSRVKSVCACLLAYEEAGYRVLLPGEANWPEALYALGTQMPLFLFARGEQKLLACKSVAVAGSRHILLETQRAAASVGQGIAREGLTLVTGGAAGVDAAALNACWQAGGCAVLVPALPAAQILRTEAVREALDARRLLLLSDALPDDPFSAKRALARNHVIYALGRAAVVVAARQNHGGSWQGAVDCLRGGWRPVFVWDGQGKDTEGNRALLAQGARPLSLERNLSEQLFNQEQMGLFAEC